MRLILFALLLFASAIHAQHGHKTGSGVASLDVTSSGLTVHLLVGRADEQGAVTLFYMRSSDGGENWGPQVEVGEGQPPPTVKRGADARIAVVGDRLVAVWTAHDSNDRFGRGGLVTAISSDGGKTWNSGPNPTDGAVSSGQAFIAIAADRAGTLHLVWLDGRNDANPPDKAQGGKGLRYAQSKDFGMTWSRNLTLDAATCECCWNAIIASENSIHVLYRDRDPRDMSMVSSSDGGKTWSSPVRVGDFDWNIDSCPHTGGAMVRSGKRMLSTVWTGNEKASGAYLVSSPDAGATWSPPTRLGDSTSWHTDAAGNGSGRIAVAWDSTVGDEQAVYLITSSDSGATWSAPERLSASGGNATHPRLVVTRDGFRVFWSETFSDGKSVWRSCFRD